MADERFDGQFLHMAQYTDGGVRGLVDVFFSFLRRKTDFFTGSDEDLNESRKIAKELVDERFQHHAKIAFAEADSKKKDKARQQKKLEEQRERERKRIEEASELKNKLGMAGLTSMMSKMESPLRIQLKRPRPEVSPSDEAILISSSEDEVSNSESDIDEGQDLWMDKDIKAEATMDEVKEEEAAQEAEAVAETNGESETIAEEPANNESAENGVENSTPAQNGRFQDFNFDELDDDDLKKKLKEEYLSFVDRFKCASFKEECGVYLLYHRNEIRYVGKAVAGHQMVDRWNAHLAGTTQIPSLFEYIEDNGLRGGEATKYFCQIMNKITSLSAEHLESQIIYTILAENKHPCPIPNQKLNLAPLEERKYYVYIANLIVAASRRRLFLDIAMSGDVRQKLHGTDKSDSQKARLNVRNAVRSKYRKSENYACLLKTPCGLLFPSPSLARKHTFIQHTPKELRNYISCKICSAKLTSKYSLTKHFKKQHPKKKWEDNTELDKNELVDAWSAQNCTSSLRSVDGSSPAHGFVY